MNNETKRDVFDEVRYKFRNFKNEQRHGMYVSPDSVDHYLSDALKRYDAALPDDLPMIPKAVSEYLKSNRTEPLGKVLWNLGCISVAFIDSTRSYVVDHSEVFARAWVLGVWKVKETGEIVKLEAEK